MRRVYNLFLKVKINIYTINFYIFYREITLSLCMSIYNFKHFILGAITF